MNVIFAPVLSDTNRIIEVVGVDSILLKDTVSFIKPDELINELKQVRKKREVHTLKEGNIREVTKQNWEVGLFILLMCIWVYISYQSGFRSKLGWIKHVFDSRKKDPRTEKSGIFASSGLALLFSALISLSFFVYELVKRESKLHSFLVEGGLATYFLCFSGVLVFFLLKFSCSSLVFGLFGKLKELGYYFQHQLYFVSFLGVIVIPVLLFVQYSNLLDHSLFLSIGMIAITCSFIYKWGLYFYLSVFEYGFLWLYIILYICILEILPFALVADYVLSILG